MSKTLNVSDSDIDISPANNRRNHDQGPNPFGMDGETFNLATAKANEERDERAEFLKLINEGMSPTKRVPLSPK
jgi:hypothetical protein